LNNVERFFGAGEIIRYLVVVAEKGDNHCMQDLESLCLGRSETVKSDADHIGKQLALHSLEIGFFTLYDPQMTQH
jgi:hypothetical protein